MLTASLNAMSCKVCGSHQVVKDGLRKGIQRWECKACGKKFVDNHAPPGMKTPAIQISYAVHNYYEGISLNAICKYLQQKHGNYPSDSAVYNWINRFTYTTSERSKFFHPIVGDTWIVDETILNISGHQLWIWDILDKDTSFLLGTEVLLAHDAKNAQLLIQKAIEKAGKTPKVIITEKLAEYFKNNSYTFEVMSNEYTSVIERFHNALQKRTRVMNGLKSVDRIGEFANGWLLHYNYFKPQEYLNGKTPAEVARIVYLRKNLNY
jgi:putative transposase